MSSLRVRVYNVGFGDAVLVSVPDSPASGQETMRHILIDVGNVLVGAGGNDALFQPVVEDIALELKGHPADLYVMTHEHMDHVQGLLWAKSKGIGDIKARWAWLTASAAPDYYDRFPEAKKKKLAFRAAYDETERYLAAAGDAPEELNALMLNNNPRSTADCVDHLRALAPHSAYVFRGHPVTGTHPFEEARLAILAPEEDTSVYYTAAHSMALDGTAGGTLAIPPILSNPSPPPGVDAGAFYNLVERRRNGFLGNLFAIDKVANDSSVVFLIEWRGWKLLFPGDAEQASWKRMAEHGVLPESVHFLKVGHHGSWNGTPNGALLDRILPTGPHSDGRPRHAVVSTREEVYNGVPHAETLADLRLRATLHEIGRPADPLYIDVEFPG